MSQSIRKIFAEIPTTYERVNHLLTLGMDKQWRRYAARLAVGEGGSRWLDVCSGTGDMARELYYQRDPRIKYNPQIVAVDFSSSMLTQGINKSRHLPLVFTVADAGKLPFPDESFDLITIAFATRNLNRSYRQLIKYFQEFYRVLKPGGRLINLETSQPSGRLIRWFFHAYIKLTVRPIGRFISGSDKAYAYLAHTIPRFYGAGELGIIFQEVGFNMVSSHRLLFGVTAVHTAIKGR